MNIKPMKNSFIPINPLHLVLCIGLYLMIALSLNACQSKTKVEQSASETTDSRSSIEDAPAAKSPIEQYELAKKRYEEQPDDPDALIWFGRRTAYLGNYEEAIEIFSTGIKRHPEDARMYRHRGHRYISTRAYDKAISDLEQAVSLIKDRNDEIEPDGLPNSKNIPLTTLHGNIWYHLGLAYYLKNDMDNALKAFSNRTVTERYDDNIVSGSHWLYMILSRKGKPEAAAEVLSQVHTDMDIIENMSYYKMCLFYKGLISESELQVNDPKSSAANVLSYGLGNWYLYKQQDTLKAKKYFSQLLETGNTYSFAYLAAESDWERLFKNDLKTNEL